MESPFRQAIAGHLELKRRNSTLAPKLSLALYPDDAPALPGVVHRPADREHRAVRRAATERGGGACDCKRVTDLYKQRRMWGE